MTWHTYKLDEIAQALVLNALARSRDSLNQSYKMRTTIAFGLERFWGEHIRLLSKQKSDQKKSDDYQKGLYWHDTWKDFRETMEYAHIYLPEPLMQVNSDQIKRISRQFWGEVPVKPNDPTTLLTLEDRRIAQAVLTQLCDSLVWWTQRYKNLGNSAATPQTFDENPSDVNDL